ncbi:WD repeat-containing protein 62 isoform X2 [Engraulis encrasicolus]|uniref:WD repeat-containing protein 62 isoform X2 n=1 Tax=Engraulis encrasicolus TaxID=184585 RepID=UPI002FD3C62B
MAETGQLGGFQAFTCAGKKTNSSGNPSNVNVTNVRRKTRQSQKRNIHNKVVLEKVLGITTSNSSGLACDPNTGLVAYTAGCVVVILHPKKNKQTHILNTSRKTFSALAFSPDGKYLVTGESGHMPCVRVWEVAERAQVAEVQCHKYGVACVAFSPSSSYIVSVGYQYDQTVSVWEWRKGVVIASNKVSSQVQSVSFSEDNSYFVTAGNRHVKFWYLNASKERRVNSTVPLIGRSGLLGDHRNSTFCGLACGRGAMASSTYAITHKGLLCLFNCSRNLESWVELKTSSAGSLCVTEQYVFCGCADGMVRVFRPQDLHYITTLHRPHRLGVDITQGLQPGHLFTSDPNAQYPDTLALTFDPVAKHLTCVYSDHSVYTWDLRDLRNVGKVYSALYHSDCVWSVETYPEVESPYVPCLPSSAFLTCSSDNTIRLWHLDPQQGHTASASVTATASASQGLQPNLHRNLYSNDLMRIVYVEEDPQPQQGDGDGGEAKSGIRVLGVSPDGQHLAAGDRNGSLRIFELQFLDEIAKIVAHDSEVLCLEFSPTETGLCLLASASRDRLIHIFNISNSYTLEQTVYDHSGAITAIKFSGEGSEVNMVSCGADKSIYFRTAEQTSEGLSFSRNHYVAEKTTLYDMDLDSTRSQAAIACQDRNVRVYDIKSGKMMRCFKGSPSEEGNLLKVQMDPSGVYVATSCSDKSISIFDYASGECVANLFGHSEIVTGLRFSQDCRHLITVSGDSCVFVWRLDSQMTTCMRKKQEERRQRAGIRIASAATTEQIIRRETYITGPAITVLQEKILEDEEQSACEEQPHTPARDDSTQEVVDPTLLQTNGRFPMWARKLVESNTTTTVVEATPSPAGPPVQRRGRWVEPADPQAAISSLLGAWSQQQLSLTPSPQRADGEQEGEVEVEELEEEVEQDAQFHPQSLDSLMDEEREEGEGEEEEEEEEEQEEKNPGEQFQEEEGFHRPGYLPLSAVGELFDPSRGSLERSDYILYPANSTALSTTTDGEFDVKALCELGEELSPDSACCVGSAESQGSNQEPAMDADTDSLSQVSSAGSSGLEEEDGGLPEEGAEQLLRQHFDTLVNTLANDEKFDTDLGSLQPTSEDNLMNPRLSISRRFLSRFQNRQRGGGLGGGTTACGPWVAALPQLQEASPNSSINSSQSGSSSSSSTKASPAVVPNLQASTKPLQTADGAMQAAPVTAESKGTAIGYEVVKPVKVRPPLRKKQNSAPTQRPPRPLKSRHSIAAIGFGSRTLGEVTDKTLCSQSNIENVASVSAYSTPTGPSSSKPSHPGLEKAQYGYMSATTSSRAKVSQGAPGDVHTTSRGPTTTTEDSSSQQSASGLSSSTHDLHLEHGDFKENLPPPPASPLASSTILSTASSLPSTPAAATSPGPGNHSARAALRLDLAASDGAPVARTPAAQKARRRTEGMASTRGPALVTPTEMRSLGREGKTRLGTVEDGMHPPRGASASAVAPTLSSRASTTLPASCHCQEPSGRMGARDGEGHTRSESREHTVLHGDSVASLAAFSTADSRSFADRPASCSSPLDPVGQGEMVNLQMCNQIVNELRQSMKRAVGLYSKLSSQADLPDQQTQMLSILQGAFAGVQVELDSVFTSSSSSSPPSPPPPPATPAPTPVGGPPPEDSPGRQLRDQRTVALLERYSELLLKMAAEKMEAS